MVQEKYSLAAHWNRKVFSGNTKTVIKVKNTNMLIGTSHLTLGSLVLRSYKLVIKMYVRFWTDSYIFIAVWDVSMLFTV